MPKIKLIWCQNFSDEQDYHEIARWIPPEDFEDVTDEELREFRVGLPYLARPHAQAYPHIVMLDAVPIVLRLNEMRAALKLMQQQRLASAKKRIEATAKRKRTKVEQRKAQYEALKKEFDT